MARVKKLKWEVERVLVAHGGVNVGGVQVADGDLAPCPRPGGGDKVPEVAKSEATSQGMVSLWLEPPARITTSILSPIYLQEGQVMAGKGLQLAGAFVELR